MKGFVRISVQSVEEALVAHENYIDACKKVTKALVQRYYDKFYPMMSVFGRWRFRNYTPYQFVCHKCGPFGNLADVLYKVADEAECAALDFEYWRRHTYGNMARDLKNLISATNDSEIMIGDELSKFIVKFGGGI